MKKIVKFLMVIIPIFTTSCASIIDGSSQSLSVKNGSDVSGAQCELANNKGTWFVNTPGSVTVHRSYDELNVTCKEVGYTANVVPVKSTTKAMAAGNILFGGLIGVGVDVGTGAAYDYPGLITVPLQPVSDVATAEPVVDLPATDAPVVSKTPLN
jgi:hypothetical protein